jgi:hypothetical protein
LIRCRILGEKLKAVAASRTGRGAGTLFACTSRLSSELVVVPPLAARVITIWEVVTVLFEGEIGPREVPPTETRGLLAKEIREAVNVKLPGVVWASNEAAFRSRALRAEAVR